MRRSKLKSDDSCTAGTGALIIFIAMILVSSIIVATLIGVTEKITQRTDRTAEDARMKNVNTIIITGAWVYDSFDDMLFMMEFGPAGEAVNRVDVSYVLTCTDKDGTFNFRAAVLGDSRTATGQQGSDIFVWEVGTPGPGTNGHTMVDNFQPGGIYMFTLDGGTQDEPFSDECGPVYLDNEGISANLYLHIPNGMSTHQVLTLSNGREIGSPII